jgi:hypothetical protein
LNRDFLRERVGPAVPGAFSAVVFVTFAGIVWFATRGPGAVLDLFENGHWLGPASDMLAGKVPYRDTFPMHGFLSDGGRDYLVFRLFGPSFRVSLEARHALEVLFHPAVFLVAAAATRRPLLAALAVPLNIGMSIAVVADRPVPALLSLAAFTWAFDETASRRRAFLAGLLGAVGLLYALDFGTFVLTAEILTIAVYLVTASKAQPRLFRAGSYFLGLGGILVPWFALLAVEGALGPFLKVSFVDLPSHFESLWGLHFPAPWELLREWMQGRPYMAENVPVGPGIAKRFYLAPLLGGVGLLVAAWMRRKGVSTALAMRLLVLSLSCLAFYRYVVFRFHLSSGNALTGPVFLVLLVTLFESLRQRVRSARRLAASFAAIGLIVAFGMNGPGRLLEVFRNATKYPERTATSPGTVALTVPRGGGVFVPEAEERNLRALIEFTDRHSPPGSTVLDLSNRAGLYFFLRRVNPTRFAEVPPMAPFQDEVLGDLRARPPTLVFLTSGSWLDAIDGIPNSRRIPRVWSWVEENYPVRVKVGDTVVALPAGREGSSLSPPGAAPRPPSSAPRPAGRFRG